MNTKYYNNSITAELVNTRFIIQTFSVLHNKCDVGDNYYNIIYLWSFETLNLYKRSCQTINMIYN